MRAFLFLILSAACFAAQPNIILIVSDDQGYPDLGCIGTKPLITPNLVLTARHCVANITNLVGGGVAAYPTDSIYALGCPVDLRERPYDPPD